METRLALIGLVLVFSLLAGLLLLLWEQPFSEKSIEEKREEFVSDKDAIISELIVKGDYACCLKKPCMYCIEKDPKHGKGATCSCLEDIVTGKHPCGECIGEIIEGHGNPYLSKYFASALADEVGAEHLDELKQIISEKYGIPVEEQA